MAKTGDPMKVWIVLAIAAATGACSPPASAPVAKDTSAKQAKASGWELRPVPNYPLLAVLRGSPDGFVEVRCRSLPDRRVTDCEILSETPKGHGFGRAAINAAKRGRLTPEFTANGKGRRFVFPVSFRTRKD